MKRRAGLRTRTRIQSEDFITPIELLSATSALKNLGLVDGALTGHVRDEVLVRIVTDFNMGFGILHRLRNPLYVGDTATFNGNVNSIVKYIRGFLHVFRTSFPCFLLHTRKHARKRIILKRALLAYVHARRLMITTLMANWVQQELVLRERAKSRLHAIRSRNHPAATIAAAQEEYLLYFMHPDLKLATVKRMFLLKRLQFAKKLDAWQTELTALESAYKERKIIAHERALLSGNREALEYERLEVLRCVFTVGEHRKKQPKFALAYKSVRVEELVRLAIIVRDAVTDGEDELIQWERERYFKKLHNRPVFRIEKSKSVCVVVVCESPRSVSSEASEVLALTESIHRPLTPVVHVITPELGNFVRRQTVVPRLHSAEPVVCSVKDWRPVRIVVTPSLDKVWSAKQMKEHLQTYPPAPLRALTIAAGQGDMVGTYVRPPLEDTEYINEEVPELDLIVGRHAPGRLPIRYPLERNRLRVSGSPPRSVLGPPHHPTASALKNKFTPFVVKMAKDDTPCVAEDVMRGKRSVRMSSYVGARLSGPIEVPGGAHRGGGRGHYGPLPPGLQVAVDVCSRPLTGTTPSRKVTASLPTPSFLGRDTQQRVRAVLQRETKM